MVEVNVLKELNTRLRNKGRIWINEEYMEAGELIKKELFLRISDFGFTVGFDHYPDKYEDTTDLYITYLRKDFDRLSDAIDFCAEALSVKMSDFLER
ncbi:hypothetical protein [Pseudomonas sp. UFMG81]|uniref:hypothetical protein n=1 Tax=Pseudomonas sp. UFMG81 TaxID=2745936 RepID=UPI00188E92BD|nr:hypothetical protein [Pseudomonas sp. UFMG81]